MGRQAALRTARPEPASFSDYDTPQSELYYACSKGGKQAYPYGDSFDPAACATDGRDQTLQVKSLPGCEGGFAGIYDLSGNVGEWQAPCSIRNGPDDICRLGSYGVLNSSSAVDNWSCGADYTLHRNTITNFAGIRCCSDVL